MNKLYFSGKAMLCRLTFLALMLLSGVAIHAQDVAILLDPDYENPQGGCLDEYTNTRETYQEYGYTVTPILDIAAPTLAAGLMNKDVLVIPEHEAGDFVGDLTPAAKTELQNFVSSGKGLIIHGGTFFPGSQAYEILNAIFNFSLMDGGGTSSGNSAINVAHAAGTSFQGGPATVPNLSGTHFLTGTLPAGTRCVYEYTMTQTTAAIIPYGAGEIIFLGWDWFNGGNGCPNDNSDWESLLQSAVAQAAACSDFSAPTISDGDGPDCDQVLDLVTERDYDFTGATNVGTVTTDYDCLANLTWTTPVFADNVAVDSLAICFRAASSTVNIPSQLPANINYGPNTTPVPASPFVIPPTAFYNTDARDECMGSTRVTYKVYDACGNVDSCDFIVRVTDNERPDAVCNDINVKITGQTVRLTQADIDAIADGSSDNCGLATVDVSQKDFTLADVGPNTVSLILIDNCGAVSNCNATVYICLPPQIMCPADNYDLPPGCNPDVPAPATTFNDGTLTPDPALPTTMFGCPPLRLISSDDITDVGCIRTVTRTYRIVDDCGQIDECDQTFTFTFDTIPPTFNEMLPMDMTVECDAIPEAAVLTATDNCAPMAMPTITPFIFINELHYDNTGGDTGEFIEVVGTAGYDLSDCDLVLYNGATSEVYNTMTLNGMIDDEGAGIGAVSFGYPSNGIQNGSPDGIALVCDGTVVEFISYEGTITAADGPAAGMTSTDIGVSEPGAIGESIQRTGTGCLPGDFGWVGPIAESPGSINAAQTFSGCAMTAPPAAPFVRITEIHYDNTGGDTGEFIEISGTTGFDLSSCSVELYNGSTGASYGTLALSGIIPDEGAGYGALAFLRAGIQNGSPDGLALICNGAVVEFLSYEGAFTAADGPAMGMMSTDIGVSETSSTPIGESLQLTGMGCDNMSLSWTGPLAESPGSLNAGLTFDGCPAAMANLTVTFMETETPAGTCPQERTITRTWDVVDACDNAAQHVQTIVVEDNTPPVFVCPPADTLINCDAVFLPVVTAIDACEAPNSVWANEFHYDNAGADAGEFIEVAGVAGIDLAGYSLVVYNGFNGQVFSTIQLSGVLPNDSDCGFGALSFDVPGLMNGAPDGFALVTPGGTVLELLSYEGTFTATNGPAAGMLSTDVGVSETSNTPTGQSLQRTGMGAVGSDFSWVGPLAESRDALNAGQEVQGPIVAVLLSEVRADGNCPYNYTLTRTWEATDACDNSDQYVQVVTVQDTTKPVLVGVPADTLVDCDAVPAPAMVTATDNCDTDVTPVFDEMRTDGDCPFNYTLTRTWTATDSCGNSSQGIQIVTVQDTTKPVLVGVPADILVDCDAVPAPAMVTATDNCDMNVIPVFDEMRTDGDCPFNYILTRTWTATDNCNNTSQEVQVVTVQDTTPPTPVCLDITVELDRDGMATITAAMLDGGSSDNCSATADLIITASKLNFSCDDLNQNGTPGCSTIIPVTLTVEDECSNVATCIANVTLQDNIAPVIQCNNDLTITLDPGECRTSFSPIAFGADNCDTDVTITQLEGPADGELLEGDSVYVFTFQAEDNCTNTDACTFSVTVLKNTDPIISLACNDLINVTLDTMCQATITPDDVLEGDNHGCYEDYIVDLFYDANLTQMVPTSPTVTSSDLGRRIYSRVTDPATGLSCWGEVNLEDKTPPVISCPCEQGGTPVTSVSGSLDSTDPMFSRPNNIGMNPGNCTPQAAQYFYDRFDFTIDQADIYTFTMPNIIGPDFFFALYSGGFDPADPCNNLLATDDDSNGTEPEITIQLTLTPGNYTLVTTTFFANDPDGAYTFSISSLGGGNVLQRDPACIVKCFDDLTNFPPAVATDACGIASLTSTDQTIDGGNCGNSTILRTWVATDLGGNTATCTQEFIIEPATLADVTGPANYDGIDGRPTLLCENRCGDAAELADTRSCGETDLYWNVIPDGSPYAGHPSPDDGKTWACGVVKCFGTGRPNAGATCGNIQSTFADTRLNICTSGPSEGCYKILRNWTVLDWCTGEIAFFNQVIKVEDNEAPQIADIADLTISVDVWGCEADWLATEPWLMDNCSSEPLTYTVSSTGGIVQALPDGRYRILDLTPGQYQVTYSAADCCGNVGDSTITLTVVDDVAPVAVCDGHTVVSISRTVNIQDENLGLTKIFATTFDDGSFDNCSDVVYFKAIRMDEYDSNGNGKFPETVRDGDWASIDCDAANGDDDLRTRPSYYQGPQSYFDDHVKFCCADIAVGPIMVVFRVYDVDPEPYTFGRQFPSLVPTGEDPDDYNGVLPEAQDVGGALYGHYDDCMVEVSVQDKLPPYVVAPPSLTVTCDYWFPFDADNPQDYTDELDALFGKVIEGSADPADRDSIVITDRVCPAHPRFAEYAPANPADDQCYDDKYDIFWGYDGYVLDNCSIELEQTIIPDLHCGRGDIIRRWRAGDDAGNWSNTATQVITIIDCKEFYVPGVCWRFTPGDIGTCDRLSNTEYKVKLIEWPCDVEVNRCQTAGLDAFLPDNLPIPFDQDRRPRYDDDNCNLLGATYTDRTFTFVDNACVKIFRDWTVIDWCLYEDGVTPYQWEWTQVIKLLNTEGPVFDDCEDREFCGFGDPAFPNNNQCVGEVVLEPGITDDCSDLATIRTDYKIDAFNDGTYDILGYSSNHPVNPFGIGANAQVYPATSPNANGKYPVGEHRILWTAEDGCGNITTCEYRFTVQDCKPPTPYCRNGVSTIPMPIDAGGYVDIWASDYNIGSYDNCTAQGDLIYSFSDDPTDLARRFTCADAPGLFNLTVYVWDLGLDGLPRNYATCGVTIQLEDCANQTTYSVAGAIETEAGIEASNVTVGVSGDASTDMTTDNSGTYGFNLPASNNYVVTPAKDLNHRNGVSTFDLVLISKHITGQQALNSPFKMIAADVNSTGSISTFDIIELRKLILYINTEFPDNTSWRFVDQDFQFADPNNPFASSFPEAYDINGLDQDMDINFVAIKVGDVNGSAQANNLTVPSQTRSAGELNFNVQDQLLNAGQTVTVDFTAADFANILGYQFTLNYSNAVEVTEVQGGVLAGLTEGNFGKLTGAITTSWNTAKAANLTSDEVVFSITLTANANVKLSDVLSISSEYTTAEAYNSDAQFLNVALNFTNNSKAFALYQNQPNPFAANTVIGFNLPQAGTATLSIYDVAGKVLKIVEGEYSKGYNEVAVERSELNGIGVLYYTLETADNNATKKMIIIE